VEDTRDTELVRVGSDLRSSGVSKVNPVCSKTRGNRKVMQSRDATFDLGHARDTIECDLWACRK
jgi:hypothetical protein